MSVSSPLLSLLQQTIPNELSQDGLNTFLLTLFEETPNIMFVKDRDGKYVMVNKAFTESFGISLEDVIGKTDYDFMDEPQAAECTSSDQPARQHKGEVHSSFELERDDDGSIRNYIVVNKHVITTNAGEYLIGTVAKVAV